MEIKKTINRTKYQPPKDKGMEQFLKEVYKLVLSIENREWDLIKRKRKINKMLENEAQTYHRRVKFQMCPLGEECPGFVGPRWPTTNIETTKPLGHNCFFAHTYLELKFAKDVVNIKSQLITKTIKIEGSLFVEGNVEFQKSLNAENINTNNIDCSDINCNRIQLEGDFITKSNCETKNGGNMHKSYKYV